MSRFLRDNPARGMSPGVRQLNRFDLVLFDQIFEAWREPKICRFALFFGLALVNLKVDRAAYPSRGCQVIRTFLGKMPYSIICTWPRMSFLSSRVERAFLLQINSFPDYFHYLLKILSHVI